MAKKTARIPLASAYNTRMSAVGNASGSTAYAGIAVAGQAVAGATVTVSTKDARYVNCFTQTIEDQISGSKRLYVVKRPGFADLNTPASGDRGYAVLVWAGKGDGTDVITAFGAVNSTIYNGTTSLGSITGRCTGITETVISGTPTLIFTSTDNTAWYYDTDVGTVTKITDSDFPGNGTETVVGTFAHLDGFACVLTESGQLWAGDINSGTGWTANSFGDSNAYPDQGVGCVRHRNFIIAFSTTSTEFWYNAGLSPFPLARATALTAKVGALSAACIGSIADTLFWVGAPPEGGISVYQYDGNLSRISHPEQDAALGLAGPVNISLTTMRSYGRSFVLVIAGSRTYVYCVEEKMWAEWSSDTTLWTRCAGISKGSTMVTYAVSDRTTSGKVYVMNEASQVFQDSGSAYTATIQTPIVDFGTRRRKFWEMAEVIGDEESSTSTLTLAAYDDDYQTSTSLASIDLSTDTRRASRLGSSRRRAWLLTHGSNTPMRLEALELTADIGSH
jgi:hypothetical protein